MKKLDRRNFLKKSSLSGAALVTGGLLNGCATTQQRPASGGQYMGGFAAPKLATVRAAFIGVGARGGDHLTFLAKLPGTEVVAISDLYEDNVKKWAAKATEIGAGQHHQNIALYHGDEKKWQVMLDEVKPDVVFIATNWKNHAPMAIAAMKPG